MAYIITKDEFISKYLIGTSLREIMLFNSDRIAVGVKEHGSFSLGNVNFNWSYARVNILKNKNNIYLSYFPLLKDINPELVLKFPIEMTGFCGIMQL